MVEIFEAKEKLMRELGWKENPFVKDLRVFDREEFMKYYCPSESARMVEKLAFDAKACMLIGPKGVGKTSALYYVMYSLPEKEFSYLFLKQPPANLEELAFEVGMRKSAIEHIAHAVLGAKRRVARHEIAHFLRSKHKKTVLFVDEAHLGSSEMLMEFKYLLDEVPNLRLVLAALGKEEFPDSLLHLFGQSNIFQRTEFSAAEMKVIIEHRISAVGGKGLKPFTESFLKTLLTEQNLLTPRYVFDGLNNELARLATKGLGEAAYVGDGIIESAVAYNKELKGEKAEKITNANAKWWPMLSPSQQQILQLLLQGEGLTLAEIMEKTSLKQNTVFNALYQMEGNDSAEVKRKPGVPFPLVSVSRMRVGKKQRNVYSANAKIRNLFTMH